LKTAQERPVQGGIEDFLAISMPGAAEFSVFHDFLPAPVIGIPIAGEEKPAKKCCRMREPSSDLDCPRM
jgi:hypothetical protein